ncbi:MAG: hypothetical protein IPM46_11170 [Flavobacteriales bacterium]|nr:hypothetical protein [Flavobacteriales bacterium]
MSERYAIGTLVRLKAEKNSPEMVVNGERLGKLECIWFEQIPRNQQGGSADPENSRQLMRAYIHSAALLPVEDDQPAGGAKSNTQP